jgi:hypothetical protein
VISRTFWPKYEVKNDKGSLDLLASLILVIHGHPLSLAATARPTKMMVTIVNSMTA